MLPNFRKRLDKIIPLLIISKIFIVVTIIFVIWYYFSPTHTDVGYQPNQPINYSHKVHVEQLGLDCRYCHINVEKSPHATVPPSEICMNCHDNNIKKNSEEIKKLWAYHKKGESIPWKRVHNLPDYAYFSHEAHVNVGVACVSCHGRVDKMPKVRQAEPLSMSWCLDCHNSPKIRPPHRVTDMDYPANEEEKQELVNYLKNVVINPSAIEVKDLKESGRMVINPPKQECSACHR